MSQQSSVQSNRETGQGFADYMFIPKRKNCWAFIIELKRSDHEHEMNKNCKEGMDQIKNQNYVSTIRAFGFNKIKLVCLCFYLKKVIYLEETITDSGSEMIGKK